jgi:hypothetical protein
MRMQLIAALTAASLAGACSRNNAPTEVTRPGVLALNVNESGDTEGVTVNLVRVENESRCPSGVMCVWEGNAAVVITVRTPLSPNTSLAPLTVNTSLEPRSVAVDGYRVALDSLKPYPVAGKSIEQKDYVAFLTVTKTSGSD